MSRIRIKSVHIKNYRSIKDTGKIEINDKVTVFAGKNESGKTNILEAIQSFYQREFKEDDIPVDNKSANPEVKVNFEMNDEYICEKLNIKIPDNKNKFSLCITRSKKNIDKYEGSILEIISTIFLNKFSEKEECVEYINEKECFELIKLIINSHEDEHVDVISKKLDKVKEETEKQKITQYIISLLKELKINEMLNNLIPQIAYFDSFEDKLPDELKKDDIIKSDFDKKNSVFINLLHMLDMDKQEFIKKIEGNVRNQSSEFKTFSEKITQKYNSVYLQEKVAIGLDKNGDKIFVQIFDEGDKNNDTKPSQRSQGFQWFIAFYLLLNSLDDDAIILIDEPGLYLHATAQKDILKFLNEDIKNMILFTTHSPYLIDIDKLDSLNLVRKSPKLGTIVNQKYYECSDQDTITPLITAIGYNIAKNPLEIGNGLNIITEGISDRFYMLSFLKLKEVNSNINIIPSRGSSNMHLLVAMVIGWNLEYLILLDKDSGGNDAIEQLKGLYINEEEMNKKIVFSVADGSIENIFSKEDKNKYKISKNRKVISSYNFYKNVYEGTISFNDLSSKTQNNIDKIIEQIEKAQ